MSFGCFSQGMSGWRRMVPVAEQGASRSTASNFSAGCHFRMSAASSRASRPRRRRFSPRRLSRLSEISTAVTFAPEAASSAVLPPGAAQRSATLFPRTSPRSFAGQRGRGVLHPPGALLEAVQVGDAVRAAEPDRAGRQKHAAETLGPERRHRFSPRGRGRHLEMRVRRSFPRSPRHRHALQRSKSQAGVFDPAGIFARRVLGALAHELPERAVHEPARAAGAVAAARLRDREVDRGVIGNVEEENLRRGDMQDRGKRAGVFRQLLVERLSRAPPRSRRGGGVLRPGWRAPARGRGGRARESADCRVSRRGWNRAARGARSPAAESMWRSAGRQGRGGRIHCRSAQLRASFGRSRLRS